MDVSVGYTLPIQKAALFRGAHGAPIPSKAVWLRGATLYSAPGRPARWARGEGDSDVGPLPRRSAAVSAVHGRRPSAGQWRSGDADIEIHDILVVGAYYVAKETT